MAHVMALQQGWSTEDLTFQGIPRSLVVGHPADCCDVTVNNDIHGLIASVNGSSTSAFMWEWFTTKPFLDRGDVRFVRQQHLLRFYGTFISLMIARRSGRSPRHGHPGSSPRTHRPHVHRQRPSDRSLRI